MDKLLNENSNKFLFFGIIFWFILLYGKHTYYFIIHFVQSVVNRRDQKIW